MKRDITNTLSPELRDQLDFLAKSLGKKSFFIQDTETTGITESDQIHDFAGLYYNNGKVYQVQYYVVQPNDRDEEGRIHFDFNALRKLHEGSPAFKTMMGTEGDSNAAYKQMREAMDKKTWDENDPMITRENLAKLLKDKYAKVPNFTYNAIFDIKMEKKLESAINSKIKFSEVYDVMTIALSTMPEIMPAKMGKELGIGKLEKVYQYLSENYGNEFNKFKTTAVGGAQQHTAWSDIFEYTVPVLNFFLHQLRNRGCDILSFKNIQAFFHTGRDAAMEEIIKNGLKIGVDFSHFLSDGKHDPRLIAGAIGSQNIVAMQEMAINNQMMEAAVKGAKSAVKAQQEFTKLRKNQVENQIDNEKENIRNLQSQRRKLLKNLGTDPKIAYSQRTDIQNRINKLFIFQNLFNEINGLNKSLGELRKIEDITIENDVTKGLQNEIKKAEATKGSIRKRIDAYIDKTIKDYKGTPLGNHKIVWDGKAGIMNFKVNGRLVEVPLPSWWGKIQKQQSSLFQKIEKLNQDLQQYRVNPKQSDILKTEQELAKCQAKLNKLDKDIINLREVTEQKDALLKRQVSILLRKQRDIVKNANGKPLPPAYFENEKRIRSLDAQIQGFKIYDAKEQKILSVESSIKASQQRLKELKSHPEDVRTILINGKPVSIGISDNGKSAYYLTSSGKLGKKLPSSIWDSSKGVLRSSVQLVGYRPSRSEFNVLTTSAVMKDKSLLDDMSIIPIKMGLYTGVTKAGKGFVIRAHTSRFLDAKEFLEFGKDKIFSVSELSSTISKWFGRTSGESWNTAFGTAHHKVLEDIFSGKLKRKADGTVDPNELKKYLRKSWTYGDTETRADLMAIFEKGGKNKISEAAFLTLENSVNGVLKQLRSQNVPESAMLKASEMTLGALLNVNGVQIPISGTLDQLWVWGNQLRVADFKTSKEIGPEYVIQLSFYNLLVRALGPELCKKFGITDISKKMTIWMTPATQKKVGGIVDIKAMSDKQLAAFAFDSWTALTEKNPQKKSLLVKEIQKKWFETIDTHIGRRITDATIQTEYGEETRHFINGQTIGDIGETLNKRFPISKTEALHWQNYIDYKNAGFGKDLTFEDYLKARGKKVWNEHIKLVRERHDKVRNFINSLTTAEDREQFRNLLFLRGENGEFLYDNPIFSDYRSIERPEFNSIVCTTKEGYRMARLQNDQGKWEDVKVKVKGGQLALNEEWMKKAVEDGLFSQTSGKAATLGNFSARDWINLLKSVDLGFLYNAKSPIKSLTPKQLKKINEAFTRNGLYLQALGSLSDAALRSITSGYISEEKAEEFFALKAFLGSLQRTYEEAEKLVASQSAILKEDFTVNLQKRYEAFLQQNKNLKFTSICERTWRCRH